MHRTVFYLLILVAGLCAVTGCSKDLSRSRAKDFINDNEDFNVPYIVKIPIGTLWGDFAGWNSIDSDAMMALIRNGAVTFTHRRTQYPYTEVIIDLTPSGKDESKAWTLEQTNFQLDANGAPASNAALYSVALAQRHFKQVTGIRQDPGGHNASADFEYVWVPTDKAKPFKGLLMSPDAAFTGQATFELYDDGWRLKTISLPGRPFLVQK